MDGYVEVTGDIVGVAGDWERNAMWACSRLRDLAAAGVETVFQLGDFSVWPGPVGKRFLRSVEKVCAELGLRVYVTPGNHEDWARLYSKKSRVRDSMGALWWLTESVAVLPPGHRFGLISSSGVQHSAVSLGGAASINFEDLSRGRDWWPEEVLTLEEMARAVSGGRCDLLLSHDAPLAPYETAAVASIREHNPQGWSALARSYADASSGRVTRVFEELAPRLLAHGHFHVCDDAEVTLPGGAVCRVSSLGAERQAGNIRLLDVETLSWRSVRRQT